VITAGKYALLGRSQVTAGEHRVHVLAIETTGRQVESGPPDPPGTFVDETAAFRESFSATVLPGGPATLDFKLAPYRGWAARSALGNGSGPAIRDGSGFRIRRLPPGACGMMCLPRVCGASAPEAPRGSDGDVLPRMWWPPPASEYTAVMLSKETLESYRRMAPGERLALALRMTEASIPALLEGSPETVARRFQMLARENDDRNRNMLTAVARTKARP
jgi:hypothetical protein